MEQFATIGQLHERLEQIDKTLLRAELGGGVPEEKLTQAERAALQSEADGIVGAVVGHFSKTHSLDSSEIVKQLEHYRGLLRIAVIVKWANERDLDPSVTEKLQKIFGGTLTREESRSQFRELLDSMVVHRRNAGRRKKKFLGITLPWFG